MAAVETAVDVPIEVSAATPTETTADAAVLTAVAERLQFFFSNANIRQDAFMRRYLLVSSTKEDDDKYSVPISALLKFHTIQRITTSPEVIVQAAETHLSDTLVVVKATGEKKEVALKRRVPFTKDLLSEHIPLSLYVSNLPLSDDKMKYTVTVSDVRQLFDDDAIALVKLKFRPRSANTNKDPKDDGAEEEPSSSSSRPKWIPSGGAMVEFKTLEALQTAAAATLTMKEGAAVTPERPLTMGGAPLQVMLLSEYKDRAEDKTTDKKEKETGSTQEKSDVVPEETSTSVFTMDWKPGCVIVLEGMANSTTTTANDSEEPVIECDREAILEAVAKGLETTVEAMKEQKMVYVDYSRGQTKGAIRFSEPSDQVAAICQSLQDKTLTIANVTVESVRVLSGTEEQEYWDRFIQFKNQQKQNHQQEKNSKRKGGGSHGGHHGKRSRRRY